MTGSDGISTYSQDLVVINAMMRGDQRIVGNRELSGDLDLPERVLVGGDGLAINHEERGQLDAAARFVGDLVNLDDVTHCHLVLAAATTHDRVHA